MLKKIALVLITLCCAAFAGEVYSIQIDESAKEYFALVGAYPKIKDNVIGQESGKSVVLKITQGYVATSATANYGDGETVEITPAEDDASLYEFVMPKGDVVIKGSFEKGTYSITANGCDGKILICEGLPDKAKYGAAVTFKVTLTTAGNLGVKIRGGDDAKKSVEGSSTNVSFTMGPGDAIVTLTFTGSSEKKEDESKNPELTLKGNLLDLFNIQIGGKAASKTAEEENFVQEIDAGTNVVLTLKKGFEITEADYNCESYDESFCSELTNKVDVSGNSYAFNMPNESVVLDFSGTGGKVIKVDGNTVDFSGSLGYNGHLVEGAEGTYTLKTSETYEKIDFTVTGIDKEDVSVGKKTVEKSGKTTYTYTYTFIQGDEDIYFTFTAVKPASSSSSAEPEPSSAEPESSSDESTIIIEPRYYKVNIVESEKGEIQRFGTKVTGHSDCSYEQSTVSLNVEPKEGYLLDVLTIKDADGKNVNWTKRDSYFMFTMPGSDVTVSATYKTDDTDYLVVLDSCDGKNLKCEGPGTAKFGDKVTIKVTKAPGVNYSYEYTMNKNGDPKVDMETESSTVETITFFMPAFDMRFVFDPYEKKDGSSSDDSGKSGSLHKMIVASSDNGKIEIATSIPDYPGEMLAGYDVVLWVTPKAGYALDKLTIKDASGKDVKWEKDESGYVFVMPESDVKISATYKIATYSIDVDCGALTCFDYPKTAHYGEAITIKVSLKGVKGEIPFSTNADIKKEQKGTDLILTFTMPDWDVKISFAKDGGKSGKGGKDAIAAVASLPMFNVQVQNRSVNVSGASMGAGYALLNANGSVVAKGSVNSSNFGIVAPNAGKFILRIGRQVRTLNVK